MRILTTLVLLGGGVLGAQTFEVASIKAAPAQEMNRIMVSMGGDPGRLDYKNVSLRDLVRDAYGVKDYQVTAPDWMNSTRFDLQAKYPPDTPREVRNVMMQNLLQERFGLKAHKENKELPVYSLVVGKNGPKLKKAEEQPTPATADGPAPGGPTNVGGPAAGAGFGVGGSKEKMDEAMAKAKSGGPLGGGGGRGMMMMRMAGGGKMNLQAKSMTMAALSDMLARQVGRPVFDNTGIDGKYDIELEFKPEMGGGMMRGMPPMGHPEVSGDGPAPQDVEAASIFTAVQDQLGLKLESKKGPVESVIVDRCEKTPTEN